MYNTEDSVVKVFETVSHIQIPLKNCVRLNCYVTGVGFSARHLVMPEVCLALEKYRNIKLDCNSSAVHFDRIILLGIVLHSLEYSKQLKICDAFVLLTDTMKVGALRSCLVTNSEDCNENNVCLIFRMYKCRSCVHLDSDIGNLMNDFYTVEETSELRVFEPHDVKQKLCIFMSDNKVFAVSLPYFELD